MKILNNFLFYISLLLPISLFSGPAVADINITLICVLFLIISISSKSFSNFQNKHFYYFLYFCLFFIFTSLISTNVFHSLESSLFYFRFGLFSLALFYLLKNNKKFLKYFALSILLSTFFVSIDAIIEYYTFNSLVNFFIEKNYYTIGRISGVFGEEFILGSYLVRLLPLSLGLIYFLNYNIKIVKLITIIYFLTVSLAVFISGERTALFMLIIFILLIMLVFKKINREYLILGLVFFLIAAVSFLNNSDIKNRLISKTFNDFQSKLTDNISGNKYKINFFSIQHEVVYKTSLKIVKDNIYFGIGPKMFRIICKNDKYKTFTDLDRSINGCQSHSHNTYVQILTETGILGLLAIIIIFSIILFKVLNLIISNNLTNNNIKMLKIYCLLGLFINFWPLMPSGNFFNNWLSIVYFLPVAFLVFSSENSEFKN